MSVVGGNHKMRAASKPNWLGERVFTIPSASSLRRDSIIEGAMNNGLYHPVSV